MDSKIFHFSFQSRQELTSINAFEVLQLLKGIRTPQLNTTIKSHQVFVGPWKKLIGSIIMHLVNHPAICSNEVQNMNNYLFLSKLTTEMK